MRVGQAFDIIILSDQYFTKEEKEDYQNWLQNEYENEKWMFDKALNKESRDYQAEINTQNIEKN